MFFFFPIVKMKRADSLQAIVTFLSGDRQDKFGGLHEGGSSGGRGPTNMAEDECVGARAPRSREQKKTHIITLAFVLFCFVFAQHLLFVLYSGFFA